MCLQRIESYSHGKATVIIYFKILAYILDINEYHIQAQNIKTLAFFYAKLLIFWQKIYYAVEFLQNLRKFQGMITEQEIMSFCFAHKNSTAW